MILVIKKLELAQESPESSVCSTASFDNLCDFRSAFFQGIFQLIRHKETHFRLRGYSDSRGFISMGRSGTFCFLFPEPGYRHVA